MSSTDKLVIPAYKQGAEREFNEWFRNLRTAAKQHKYLLDIIAVSYTHLTLPTNREV